jgi:hypothetical protein
MTAPQPHQPNRALWGLLLIFSSLWLGLAAGMAIGARFVPAGSGLAGPAIALGYGAFGSLMAGLLAGLLVWRVPARTLRTLAALGFVLSLVVFGFLIRRMAERQATSSSTGVWGHCPAVWLMIDGFPQAAGQLDLRSC